ncbi:hypothetical protein BV898_13673 [Hypsibius exemplaris]|uniref:Uncharacterized protein n=1 Tax=Hypsibius exemplaris TaxID=2072580 RepID=A0A1W0WA27_HYPEX|nr:hypothetical protein BV898_13673 [Hypsibius exemplaris]
MNQIARKEASLVGSSEGSVSHGSKYKERTLQTNVSAVRPHGDHSFGKTDAAKRLLPREQYLSLQVLEKLANKVQKYASVLQGDSGEEESYTDEESDSRSQSENSISIRLKTKMRTYESFL